MADQEIAKHTKKVYKVWASREHSWQHKLKEFIIEIMIIVFAVSISIWFHNMSEKSHDRHEAKEYLEGLKKDLVSDIQEMQNDSLSFAEQLEFFQYLVNHRQGALDTSFVKSKFWIFSNQTALIPNISRFEALKYSGKMNIIENKDLLDEILNLYEEKIPVLVRTANDFNNYKNNTLGTYIEAHRYNSKPDLSELYKDIQFNADFSYYLVRMTKLIPRIMTSYHDVIQQNEKLIAMIGKEIK
jgi:hypothetical protein